MENNPKKSKALIITIIIIIFLLLIGFLVYKNRDKFSEGTSGVISKIFSPLAPSKNSKDVKTSLAQAGEDIQAGDNLSLSGYDENNNPIVVKAVNDSNIYGFANQDILNGEFGQISINNENSNNFWDSFSNFLNNLFGNDNNNSNDLPPGGWSFNSELGIWEFDPNGIGGWVFDPNTGGWVPPGGSGNYNPQCSDNIDNDNDETIDANDPNCHIGGTMDGNYVPTHYSESSNPLGGGFDFTPQCSDTLDNDEDETIDENDPNCHVGGVLDGDYLPNHYSESSNPLGGGEIIPKCSDNIDNDTDTLIDDLDPACHIGGTLEGEYLPNYDSETDAPCENGANNPPLCTVFEEEKIPDLTAGSISPTNALSGAQTTISVSISNIGNGNTVSSFPTLFTITNKNMTDLEINGDDNIISQSKFKKIISKIFNKATWTSIVKAATTGNNNIIINENLSTTTQPITAGESKIVTTTYNFNTPGIYYIRACADKSSINDRGVIVETNEDNNCGSWTIFNATVSLPPPGELPQCSDGTDNDRDRLIDDLDPACHIDGDINKTYVSSHDNESNSPNARFECNDSVDNDNDGLIDDLDPACHIDGEINKNYVAEHDSELTPPLDPNTQTEENICLAVQQNPLIFTDQEKSELAELLRKFYLLAPNLKSEDDISIIYDEIERYREFIGELTTLTNQCYNQGFRKDGSVNPAWDWTPTWDGEGTSIDAPMHRFGNPWFKGQEKDPTQRYFDNNLIDCKYMSGYYSGETRTGGSCDELFTLPPMCDDFYHPKLIIPPSNPIDINHANATREGCKWNPGTHFREVELLLNVW